MDYNEFLKKDETTNEELEGDKETDTIYEETVKEYQQLITQYSNQMKALEERYEIIGGEW